MVLVADILHNQLALRGCANNFLTAAMIILINLCLSFIEILRKTTVVRLGGVLLIECPVISQLTIFIHPVYNLLTSSGPINCVHSPEGSGR